MCVPAACDTDAGRATFVQAVVVPLYCELAPNSGGAARPPERDVWATCAVVAGLVLEKCTAAGWSEPGYASGMTVAVVMFSALLLLSVVLLCKDRASVTGNRQQPQECVVVYAMLARASRGGVNAEEAAWAVPHIGGVRDGRVLRAEPALHVWDLVYAHNSGMPRRARQPLAASPERASVLVVCCVRRSTCNSGLRASRCASTLSRSRSARVCARNKPAAGSSSAPWPAATCCRRRYVTHWRAREPFMRQFSPSFTRYQVTCSSVLLCCVR